MTVQYNPRSCHTYSIERPAMMSVRSGTGAIEVDFKHYRDWSSKIIFLEPGQYIRFPSDDFTLIRADFDEHLISKNPDTRVLFKHLVSLGYIEIEQENSWMDSVQQSQTLNKLIAQSSQIWYRQNPFNATRSEYQYLFDIKELIDGRFREKLSRHDLKFYWRGGTTDPLALFKTKVGITIHQLKNKRRLLEGQRALAFTSKSVKEITYDLGLNDPAYFIRFFKRRIGQTPEQFRETLQQRHEDSFSGDLHQLIKSFHATRRDVAFYADQMNMSGKTLSKKVKHQFNTTIGQIIRQEIIKSARELLIDQLPVNEVAFQLGFPEANHFSAFFKRYTGLTPIEFQNRKCNQ